MKPELLSEMRPVPILVRPKFSANIGRCVRAFQNFGVSEGILIGPRASPTHLDARRGAVGAAPILAKLRIYEDWSQFFEKEPEGLRVAFTRREGRGRRTMLWQEVARELQPAHLPEAYQKAPVYLIFGPEDHGLADDDLVGVHRVCRLPAFSEMGSLSLPQAVLLALFILRQAHEDPRLQPSAGSEVSPSPRRRRGLSEPPHLEQVEHLLIWWLELIGFDYQKRGGSALRGLRRLLLKNLPSPDDLSILEAVLERTARVLNSMKNR